MRYKQKITAIVPAMNEEQAIGKVVSGLYQLKNAEGKNWIDQVIVSNNASSDNTEKQAIEAGAKVVNEARPGYGQACLSAIDALELCDIVLFIDGDHSVVIEQTTALLEAVTSGYDLAIGSRTLGKIETGALTITQRFGNWLATKLIGWLWSFRYTDLGPCRAIRRDALERLAMQDKNFGWTVEMQIKALQFGLAICERPIDSRVRIGTSKISGTIKGVIGAGKGIIGTILLMRFAEFHKLKKSEFTR